MAFAIGVEGRWILMDTGIGTGNAELDELYAPQTQPLANVLANANVPLGAIEGVVNSHLHFDHCGQNLLFPNRPIWVQSAEWAAAQVPDYTIPEWVDFPGARYELIDGRLEVLPGISIVPTPGHTPGHQIGGRRDSAGACGPRRTGLLFARRMGKRFTVG
jgi:N-acyl homoserine lactone hydrolase